MNIFTFTKLGRALLLAGVVAVSAVCWAGCGGDGGGNDNPADNSSNNSSNNNSNGGNNTVGNNTCTSGGSCKSKEMPDGKKWLTENLNVETAGSWCYRDSNSYCNKYGRLYTWEDAKSACQSVGMRLPTNAEWNALVTVAGGSSTSGKKLKSTNGWYNNGNGTDDYGFSAKPGGEGGGVGSDEFSVGFFDENAGNRGYWWTATEGRSDDAAYDRYMYYNYDSVNEGLSSKLMGYSVRCVQD